MDFNINPAHVGILNGLGFAIKHAVPTKKVNRFIPLFNFAAAIGMRLLWSGGEPSLAVAGAMADAVAATGTHKTIQQVKGLERL